MGTLLFLFNLTLTLATSVADPQLPALGQQVGGPAASLGLLLAAVPFTRLAAGPLAGRVSDRLGAGRALLGAALAVASLALALPRCEVFPLLVAVRGGQGLAMALARPALVVLVNERVKLGRAAQLLGRFDTSFYGALALGPVLGGWLRDHAGLRAVFDAAAGLAALALVLAALVHVRAPGGGPRQPTRPTPPVETRALLAQTPLLRGLAYFIAGRAWGIAVITSLLPGYLVAERGLSHAQAGGVLTAVTLSTAALLPGAGWLADRVPRRWLVFAGAALAASCCGGFCLAAGPAPVVLLALLLGGASGLTQPASAALLLEAQQGRAPGQVAGVFLTALNLGALAGSLTSGGAGSARGALLLAALAGLAGTCGFARCCRPPSRGSGRPQPALPPRRRGAPSPPAPAPSLALRGLHPQSLRGNP